MTALHDTTRSPGTLVLVVGASGAGKDTLIAYCRSRLSGDASTVFPRRLITRSAGDDTEDHDVISEEDFTCRDACDAFLLSWRAHGLGYGLPLSIADELSGGRTVIVNVSRSVVAAARRRHQPLIVAHITAPPEVVAARLRERGRETDSDINQRLSREASVDWHGPDVVQIDNSGSIEAAGNALLRLLRRRAVD